MNWNKLVQVFQTEGKRLSSSSLRKSFQEDKQSVWLLEKESVDLFLTGEENRRTLFTSFTAPSLLFFFDLSSIFTIEEDKEVLLWELEIESLNRFLVKDLGLSETFFFYLHSWVRKLSSILSAEVVIEEKNEWAFDQKNWVEKTVEFHRSLIRSLPLWIKKRKEKENFFWEKKKQNESTLFIDAVTNMVTDFNPSPFYFYSFSDPLLQACRQITNYLGVQLVVSTDTFTKASTVEERISLFCQASHIRYREVALQNNWWKGSYEPLLSFYGPEERPVALLPYFWGRYRKSCPTSQKSRILKKTEVSQFKKKAYVFYPSLPENVASKKEFFFILLRRNKKHLYFLIFYGILSALFALCFPLAIGALFKTAIPQGSITLTLKILEGLIIAGGCASFFFLLRSFAFMRLVNLISYQMQLILWDQILRLPPQFFRKSNNSNLMLKTLSAEEVRSFLSKDAARALPSGIFALFYLPIMAYFFWQLFLFVFISIVLTIGFLLIVSSKIVKIEKKKHEAKIALNSFMTHVVAGIEKLRARGAENNTIFHWVSLFKKYKKLDVKTQTLKIGMTTWNALFPMLSLFFFFLYLITSDEGQLISKFLAFYVAFFPFSYSFFDFIQTWIQGLPIFTALMSAKEILKEKQEVLGKQKEIGTLKGQIWVDNVSFSYEESAPLLFRHISLYADPGEFIALIGPSGEGKSTLVRLLLGFEKPLSGAIYIDGKNLQSLDLREVRKQMGVVFQLEALIGGSLYDNLVGGGIYTQEQVERALFLSGFAKDLESFPMGLHTLIPAGGKTLSMGQKQRLLIARVLLSNPRILILDEALSQFELKAEGEINSHISELKITRIIISHRLNSIKHADRIYVIEKGRVSDSGSFAELSTRSQFLKTMIKRQG